MHQARHHKLAGHFFVGILPRSGHCAARGNTIKREHTEGIVLHRAEVTLPGDYHYLIGRDGAIQTITPIDEKGVHACFFNGTTVAIALFGDFASLEPGKNSKPTSVQLSVCIAMMRDINKKYGGNLWAAGHSSLGVRGTAVPSKLIPGHTCPGENFPLQNVILQSGCKTFTG